MNDTHPAIAKKYDEMIMSKSPAERLAMGCSMFSTARILAIARIQENGPVPPVELRQRLFLHFYADDFDEATREKILAHIARTTPDEGQ